MNFKVELWTEKLENPRVRCKWSVKCYRKAACFLMHVGYLETYHNAVRARLLAQMKRPIVLQSRNTRVLELHFWMTDSTENLWSHFEGGQRKDKSTHKVRRLCIKLCIRFCSQTLRSQERANIYQIRCVSHWIGTLFPSSENAHTPWLQGTCDRIWERGPYRSHFLNFQFKTLITWKV